MKVISIIYKSKSGWKQSERILSKDNLRQLFPDTDIVLQLNYRKRRFGKSHSDKGRAWVINQRFPAKTKLIYLR